MRLGGERLQPFDLDLQAARIRPNSEKCSRRRIDLAGIAAIERGKAVRGLKVMATSFSVSLQFYLPDEPVRHTL
jgi:hypothetical protein